MKLQELEEIKSAIAELQQFANQQDYNTTSFINRRLVKISPKINTEIERMESESVEIHSPKLVIVPADEINDKLQELVKEDYKIIDFGLFRGTSENLQAYIKCTR